MQHFAKTGAVIGLAVGIVLSIWFFGTKISSCSEITKSNPDAYFATRVKGVSGNYCQLVVSKNYKDFIDKKMGVFMAGSSNFAGYIVMKSYILESFVYLFAFIFLSSLVGGLIGFFIEKEQRKNSH